MLCHEAGSSSAVAGGIAFISFILIIPSLFVSYKCHACILFVIEDAFDQFNVTALLTYDLYVLICIYWQTVHLHVQFIFSLPGF